MNQVLMGLETEYAFTLIFNGPFERRKHYYAESLLSLVAQEYTALYGRDIHDLFLANGGRF